MNEEEGEEVTPLEVGETATRRQTKDHDYSPKRENGDALDIPGHDQPSFLSSIQWNQNVISGFGHVSTSQDPCGSSFVDDTGGIVEELTVRNLGGSRVAAFGGSIGRERLQNNWRHLYHAREAGIGGPRGGNGNINVSPEDDGCTNSPEFLAQKLMKGDHINGMERLPAAENKGTAGINLEGIRTKMISKSGFSEFFIKHSLKGKGIVLQGPSPETLNVDAREPNHVKASISNAMLPDESPNRSLETAVCMSPKNSMPRPSDCDGVSLRLWLRTGRHKTGKIECLYIFREIVTLVGSLHSQGIALHDLRPSFFMLMQSNEVKYLGSPLHREMLNNINKSENFQLNSLISRRQMKRLQFPGADLCVKKQKFGESINAARRCSEFHSTANDSKVDVIGSQDYCNEYEENINKSEHVHRISSTFGAFDTNTQHLTFTNEHMEKKWYTSPEGGSTMSSNIYCLGVLLFELLCNFHSERAHVAAMSDIRHRILPPKFLQENPKEAGFCHWLLHPEPSSRPTTREILQSEVINGMQEVYSQEMSSNIDHDEAESELLLHFLTSLREHKQKDASKLVDDISCLETDIEEVFRRHKSAKPMIGSYAPNDSSNGRPDRFFGEEPSSSGMVFSSLPQSKLLRNVSQIESAYFSMRTEILQSESEAITHPDKFLLTHRENWNLAQQDVEINKPTDRLGAFFNGLCKYARYHKFEVCGVLRNADFNNLANVICSLSFDRDEDYFAAAGVSKKIKIFEFNALFNDSVDIHYPVIEMSNKSKLSCVCWNNYIKNYLASTDYDGIVKLWDAPTGMGIGQFTEHEKRAWSVDFSQVHPTKFASGSDDCSVKLWSISEKNCLGTIRNVANVCCVQFSAHSTHLLAFGSADYRTYCYDLRHVRSPWCVLGGHEKAVSYVKFLDSETLVTASTDNTLKIWNLNKTFPVGLSTNACNLTLTGHTNEKNFVGLSAAEGYIACGSETNEVFAYHRSLPMPVTSHKFGSIDSISGKETDDDNGQFVSSVSWRRKSDMVVAANSSGCIKVLQLV